MTRGLLLVWLIMSLVLGWRLYAWDFWRDRRLALGGEEKVVLEEGVQVSDYSCTFRYRGIFHLVRRDMCEESGLLRAQFGDWLVVTGKGVESEAFGPQFQVSRIKVVLIDPSPLISGWWWRRQLDYVRVTLSRIVRSVMSEPEASLIAGVVTGDRAAMPTGLHEALVATGTLHVVAASGYNVTVVAGMVMRVLVVRVGRRWSIVAAMAAVWLYALMAGADPPVIRAAFLLSMTLLASFLGRSYWQLWGFGFVLWVLLGLSPWLIESVSFQLSIAATVGVIWGSQTIEQWRKRLAARRRCVEISEYIPASQFQRIWNQVLMFLWPQIETTIGAWVMTAPVMLVVFGQTSWLGLVVNPLVLGFVPLLMLLGSVQMAVGVIWLPLAQVVSFMTWPVAHVWVELVELFGLFNWGTVSLSISWLMAFGWWLVVIGVMTMTLHSRTVVENGQ